jgi:hypothetical protein
MEMLMMNMKHEMKRLVGYDNIKGNEVGEMLEYKR